MISQRSTDYCKELDMVTVKTDCSNGTLLLLPRCWHCDLTDAVSNQKANLGGYNKHVASGRCHLEQLHPIVTASDDPQPTWCALWHPRLSPCPCNRRTWPNCIGKSSIGSAMHLAGRISLEKFSPKHFLLGHSETEQDVAHLLSS